MTDLICLFFNQTVIVVQNFFARKCSLEVGISGKNWCFDEIELNLEDLLAIEDVKRRIKNETEASVIVRAELTLISSLNLF